MTRYRYLVVLGGEVEADSEEHAAGLAEWEADNGLQQTTAVQVEEVREESSVRLSWRERAARSWPSGWGGA